MYEQYNTSRAILLYIRRFGRMQSPLGPQAVNLTDSAAAQLF